MKLLWIFMRLFFWISSALSDEATEQREYFDELSFEYDVTDGKLGSRGKLAIRGSDKSETEFLPDYIPSDIASLCVTGDPEFVPCLSPESVPQELKEPKVFSSIYYMWVSPTRAAIGFYVLRKRDRVELRDRDLQAFKALKNVIFCNIGIEKISGNIFDNLTQMKMIQIDSNNFTKLSEKMFSDVPHLKTLSLVDNNVSDIAPGSFDKLIRLTELFLGHNQLDVFNLELFYPLELNLEVLKLNNNKISKVKIKHFEVNSFSDSKEIPTDEFLLQMVELRVLDLQGNQLTSLDSSWLSQVPHLEELNLADNQIKFIENDAFSNMNNLRLLNLSSNKLKMPQAVWYKALKSHAVEGPVKLQYHGNEWQCNCDILEYYDFYEKEREKIKKWQKEDETKMAMMDLEITCFQPESLHGKLLNNKTAKAINQLFGCKTEEEEIQDNTEEEVSQNIDDEVSQENTDDKAIGKHEEDVERQANTANEPDQTNKVDQTDTEAKSNQHKATGTAQLGSRHSKTFCFQFDVDPGLYPYITVVISVLIGCITACIKASITACSLYCSYFKPRNKDWQSPENSGSQTAVSDLRSLR